LLDLLFDRQALWSTSRALSRANLILLRRTVIIFAHFTAFALLHNLHIQLLILQETFVLIIL
jgi:hypothetical protein